MTAQALDWIADPSGRPGLAVVWSEGAADRVAVAVRCPAWAVGAALGAFGWRLSGEPDEAPWGLSGLAEPVERATKEASG